MQTVDFLIAGGGGAGLGLAMALLDSPLRDCSIVIVDRDAKDQNDRTWCFWGSPSAPCTSIAQHSWQTLTVASEGSQQTISLAQGNEPGWRYWMVRGIDFYNTARQQIESSSNVQFLRGSVGAMVEQPDHVLVQVGERQIAARWVFDSIIRPGDVQIDPKKHHNLKQHFKGWEIETPQPAFDPARATLFDFRVPQQDDLRFFYVLPFSRNRALVEFTIFSSSLLTDEEYDAGLRDYIQGQLGLTGYTIHAEEKGSIPMSDYPFRRKAGNRILNIGTKGGLVKPSTGYAFQRMQRDARAVVDSLVRHGDPFHMPAAPARYRFYDTLLLQILLRQGSKMKPIFVKMFARNPIQRIFHFLDEDARFIDDLRVILSLPPGPFLQALWRVKVLRKL